MADFAGENQNQDAGPVERPELRGINKIKAKTAELLAANKTAAQLEKSTEAQKKAQQKALIEKALGNYFAELDGVAHLNAKLNSAADKLKTQFASEDVADFGKSVETGEPITVAKGVADHAIRELAGDTVQVSKLSVGDRERYETDAVQEYDKLLAEDAKPLKEQKKKPKLFGTGAPAHVDRLNALKKRAEEYEKSEIGNVKATAGFQELQSLLTLAGFKLEVEKKGPALEFKAYPIYADESEKTPVADVEKLGSFGVSEEVAEKLRLQGAERANAERLEAEAQEKAAAEAAAKDRLIEELQAQVADQPKKLEERLKADQERRDREERIRKESFEQGLLIGRGQVPPAERERPSRTDGATE